MRQGAEDYFRHIHEQQKPSPYFLGKHNQSLVAIYDQLFNPHRTTPSYLLKKQSSYYTMPSLSSKRRAHLFPNGIRMTDMGLNEEGHLMIRASGVLPKSIMFVQRSSKHKEPHSKNHSIVAVHIFNHFDLPI